MDLMKAAYFKHYCMKSCSYHYNCAKFQFRSRLIDGAFVTSSLLLQKTVSRAPYQVCKVNKKI